MRTLQESTTDGVSLAAAGCAFFATLSLFPGISLLISLYGLVFDLPSVMPQLDVLRPMLPPPAFALIETRILQLIARPSAHLSAGLAISFLLTLWSSASAAKAVLSALNVAYDVTERRPFLRFQAIGLAMTLGAAIVAVLTIGTMVVLPAAIAFTGLFGTGAFMIQALTFLLVVAVVAVGMALLYAHGPSRPRLPGARVLPGTVLSTFLWLASSWALSEYVAKLANFDAMYGSLGAVVGIMFWFYVSAYAALLGAELNAQLEIAAGTHGAPPEAQ